ncbi:hypothetical protein GCM10010358_58660 [Streptomyces minutiscleroticus]|uniref:Transposase n=1 Tax=Streptomyces minutiscleroticus TaxID=68238 RepID=A0A918NV37_9ACTN|nr:hypothetical protein GCM10010358_58660 [Streptomyces minutiscleroticus]
MPAWGRVRAFHRRRRNTGLVEAVHDRLREQVRKRKAAGRDAEPSAGTTDAQSVKAAASVPTVARGSDGGRRPTAASGTSWSTP